MATFTINEVRARAARATTYKSATRVINESLSAQPLTRIYDVFLSHAVMDADLILGVKLKLEDYGHSVYVDWVEDPQMDRTKVTAETAELLRARMNCCRSLFYASTPSSSQSKWMPWECGFFDGRKGKAAVLPLTDTGTDNYAGQEYLAIYPYITEDPPPGYQVKVLWVKRSPKVYCKFTEWLEGKIPYQHSF